MTSVIKPRNKISVRREVCKDNYEFRCELFVKYSNIFKVRDLNTEKRDRFCQTTMFCPRSDTSGTPEMLLETFSETLFV